MRLHNHFISPVGLGAARKESIESLKENCPRLPLASTTDVSRLEGKNVKLEALLKTLWTFVTLADLLKVAWLAMDWLRGWDNKASWDLVEFPFKTGIL